MGPRIALVVAVAENGVIGREGTLPWHLPDDLRFFKSVTMGKPVLMGRRTFESIGRPLPGRRNLMLTRSTAAAPPGIEVAPTLDAALALVGDVPEVCVIGGASVYAATLPRADRLYLTRVHARIAGDTLFPDWTPAQWREVDRSEHPMDARHAYAMSFLTLEREVRAGPHEQS
jgi:dihydrofolate reductase